MNQAPVAPANDAIVLPAEDRNRMARLYEEVHTRVEEMAMITARALKTKAGAASHVQFRPLASGPKGELPAVEVVHTASGCGCYDYSQGVCFGFTGAGSEACPFSKKDDLHETRS
jgi:hypothetical protein